MRGTKEMDKERSRVNLPLRSTVSKASQEKSAELSDLSPCHFDSGTVSDLDVPFESGSSIEDKQPGEGKITSVSSQTWTDSGVHLDSGLGIESLTSDLDIQSLQSCTEKETAKSVVPLEPQDCRVQSDACLYQDNDGDSPLHLAVVHGDPHLVFKILALYPEYLNVTNHLSQTALHLAVMLDFVRIVRRLVVCGGQLHICDHHGDTPLHLACRLGHLESLKAMTIPVIPKEVKEAGMKGDEESHSQIVSRVNQRLLQQRNYEGLTCTHLAVASSHKVLEYILQCGADINAKEGKSGKTVLHLAVERGHPDLVCFLVTMCKADVNARNYAQQTPLHLVQLQKTYRASNSSRNRAEVIMRLLREHGAELNDLSDDSDHDTEGSDQE